MQRVVALLIRPFADRTKVLTRDMVGGAPFLRSPVSSITSPLGCGCGQRIGAHQFERARSKGVGTQV